MMRQVPQEELQLSYGKHNEAVRDRRMGKKQVTRVISLGAAGVQKSHRGGLMWRWGTMVLTKTTKHGHKRMSF